MNPKITAICCTYRRPELLEEAIQSFLMQDYAGEKELIILNDEPEQELIFEHPQVKITNFKNRAPTLPTKHNHAVSQATGAIIVPWDDDDIYLPHRLSSIAERQKGGMWYSDYLFTDQCEQGLVLAKGKIHCNHAFGKAQFIRFGAYHDKPEVAFDFVLMNQIRGTVGDLGKEKRSPSYIYRKRTGTVNHSSLAKADTDKQYQEHSEQTGNFTKGRIELNPKWSVNWTGLATEALKSPPVPLHEVDGAYKPSLMDG